MKSAYGRSKRNFKRFVMMRLLQVLLRKVVA